MRAAILVVGLALSACTANLDEGFYSCRDGECPPGWHCHSSELCYSFPEGGQGTQLVGRQRCRPRHRGHPQRRHERRDDNGTTLPPDAARRLKGRRAPVTHGAATVVPPPALCQCGAPGGNPAAASTMP